MPGPRSLLGIGVHGPMSLLGVCMSGPMSLPGVCMPGPRSLLVTMSRELGIPGAGCARGGWVQVYWRGGAGMPAGRVYQGECGEYTREGDGTWDTHPSLVLATTTLPVGEWAVRILLECFLVDLTFTLGITLATFLTIIHSNFFYLTLLESIPCRVEK